MTILNDRATKVDEASDAPPPPPPIGPELPEPPLQSGFGRDGWLAIAVVIAAIAVIGSMIGIGFGMRAIDESKENAAAGGGAKAAAGAPMTVDVSLGEFFVKPASITASPGQSITLNVVNNGTMQHDLKLDGTTGTKLLDPGAKETVTWTAPSAAAQAWCTVPGHKESGMVMKIEIKGAPAAAAPAAAPAAAAAAKAAVFDPNATPGPDWKPFDPTLKPADGATEHKLILHATEKVIEVSPGVKQKLWTFGDTVPGPTLHGKVGDVFTVTLVNDGTIGHSIDFHASKVAWNDKMRTIKPGESLVYQFKADYAGIWMYHCGTAPTVHHIGNGMYGAVVIDPPDLPRVDHEYILVQSEFYLGPQGEPGDLAKMNSSAWDLVAFNGYANQYKFHPIRVEPNERVRVWVLDAGPSENSSFHIVGTIFDTVFKEGDYLLRPGSPAKGGSQALDLQPAQGGFVEFTFAEAGLYPIVTHKFANPGKGALGVFQAGEVAGAGMASH